MFGRLRLNGSWVWLNQLLIAPSTMIMRFLKFEFDNRATLTANPMFDSTPALLESQVY